MATIQNFGVPAGDGARARMLQPKVSYKFRVRVMGFGPLSTPLDLTAQVQSVTRPQLATEPVAVHSYNSIAYFGGKPTWNSVELVARDDVTNALTRLVGHQQQKQMNHFQQTSPLAGSNYKFDMKIETMDGGNDGVIETWNLENCFLENVNYGEFNYANSEVVQISMTIRYDNATQADGLMPLLPELQNGVFI
jgi:hypothetical protein